jgi:5-(carboxyamino)imidazole ribonucleotide mutase
MVTKKKGRKRAAMSKITEPSRHPRVGIIMGSRSDLGVMRQGAAILDEMGIAFELRIVSAHRTPDWAYEYAETAQSRGIEVIIAGAGGAAALPGVIAAKTMVPVLGVPVDATSLGGLDALFSIGQMPGGVPVGTMSIGAPGAKNAALFAARIIALSDPDVKAKMVAFVEAQTARILEGGTRVELDPLAS